MDQKMAKLDMNSSVTGPPAEVIIRRLKKMRASSGAVQESWEMVRARGHLSEIENLKSASPLGSTGLLL